MDLSDQALSSHLLKNEDREAAATTKRLISLPEVQQALSEPLSHDPEEMHARYNILKKHGFKPLSSNLNLQFEKKTPISIQHDELQGWFIKSGAARMPKGVVLHGPYNDRNEITFYTKEESLLRIEMANRIQKAARDANIDVVIPKKKLVAYANCPEGIKPNRKYCVVCEKINILNINDTVQAIKAMVGTRQRELAKNIATIVQKTGLADPSFDNIRLTPDGMLAFIDTQPRGLMVVKKPNLKNKGTSLETCGRIGLFTLMGQATKGIRGTATDLIDVQRAEEGLEEFYNQVEQDYLKAAAIPKLSKWKITLSVLSLGILPLIHAIVALVKVTLTNRAFQKLQKIDRKFHPKAEEFVLERSSEVDGENPKKIQRQLQKIDQALQKEDFMKDYQKKRTPIFMKFSSYVKGVPYVAKAPYSY